MTKKLSSPWTKTTAVGKSVTAGTRICPGPAHQVDGILEVN